MVCMCVQAGEGTSAVFLPLNSTLGVQAVDGNVSMMQREPEMHPGPRGVHMSLWSPPTRCRANREHIRTFSESRESGCCGYRGGLVFEADRLLYHPK